MGVCGKVRRTAVSSPNCVSILSDRMKLVTLCFIIALAVSAELPHKYMALRGWEIQGNDLKDTGNKNVKISSLLLTTRWMS